MSREQRAHLGGALQVVAVAVEAEAVGLVEPGAGLDAQQRVVGLRVLLVRVVQVVGAQQRDAEVLGDRQQRRLGLLLDGQPVVHHLGVEVLLAEDVLEVGGRLAGAVLLAGAQPHVDLARRAAGGGDQARAVALEQVAVEAGLAVLALEAGQRGDPEEVVHPLGGAGQQGHVGVRGLAAVGPAVALLVEEVVAEVERRAVEPGAGRVVALHADDRLHAGLRGLLVEVVGAEDVAVVGHRQRGHALLGRGLRHLGQLGRAVEHRVLGVDVQVRERVGCCSRALLAGARRARSRGCCAQTFARKLAHGAAVLLSGRACPAGGAVGPGRGPGDRRGRPAVLRSRRAALRAVAPDPRTPGGLLRGSDRTCLLTPDRSVTPVPRRPRSRRAPAGGRLAPHRDVCDPRLLVLVADGRVARPLVEAPRAHLGVQLHLGHASQDRLAVQLGEDGGTVAPAPHRRGRPPSGRCRRPLRRTSSRPVATTAPAASRLRTCTAVASAASCSISGGTPCSSTKTRVRRAATSGQSALVATDAVGGLTSPPGRPGAPGRARAGSAGR